MTKNMLRTPRLTSDQPEHIAYDFERGDGDVDAGEAVGLFSSLFSLRRAAWAAGVTESLARGVFMTEVIDLRGVRREIGITHLEVVDTSEGVYSVIGARLMNSEVKVIYGCSDGSYSSVSLSVANDD
jgi:hypothetical protein